MRAAEVKLNLYIKHFSPEDGSSIFIRNVCVYLVSTMNTALSGTAVPLHPLCAFLAGYRLNFTLSLSGFLQATILYGAPPLVLFLASHPGVLPNYLQSLRYVVTGAAPLGGHDMERFLKRAEPSTSILQGSVRTLYLTNIAICFHSALVSMWPVSKPTSTAGSEKRYSSITIMTLYMLYPKTRTVVKVSIVEVCWCMAWRCVTIYIWTHELLTLG
jgi:acyl-CoA synthetase (AMP-forming)/AMP-acid ligase II